MGVEQVGGGGDSGSINPLAGGEKKATTKVQLKDWWYVTDDSYIKVARPEKTHFWGLGWKSIAKAFSLEAAGVCSVDLLVESRPAR